MTAWERHSSNVAAASVGPLRLVARTDSYTVANGSRFWHVHNKDLPAKNQRAARKGAIDAARALLAQWGAELDALERQEESGEKT